MLKSCFVTMLVLSFVLLWMPNTLLAQTTDTNEQVIRIATTYRITPNITYHSANNWESKLDVYRPGSATTPRPTLIYIHGGGWTAGTKESSALTFLPYLAMGWAVVNVEYRLAEVSLAPGAVEDCRCALRWIYRNAEQYNFDLDRLVVTGGSAGGHLALTTGMLPTADGFERTCPGDRGPGPVSTEPLKVAAIINWFGITDVTDLIDGENRRAYAEWWLGNLPNRVALSKQVSPLTYVRPELPPILTIHGDADPIVPYDHALRLHKALDQAGVSNELFTVPGGGHGGFSGEQNKNIYASIKNFLSEHNIISAKSPD